MKETSSSIPGSNNEFSSGANRKGFFVVGVGASAGGIKAMQEFFKKVPVDSGMAYVAILHLSPNHDSRLAELLRQVTPMQVLPITKKTRLEPNCVYIGSPDQHLSMADGFIVPSQNMAEEDRRAPIDIFFRTLAVSHGSNAVCVILSGTGANGSMGLKRIKESGGAAFVQNPREAEYNEMPRNAIATDLVDEVLPVAEIPKRILLYQGNLGTVQIPVEAEKRAEDQQHALREIFTHLRLRTGHDFSNYKRPTLLRRIERRINMRNLPDLPAYAGYLQQNPDEITALLKDLLISVTNFFRDKNSFDVIEQEVLPMIIGSKKAEEQVRLWIAGCATGEEAYSLAMLCAERTLSVIDAPKIQIFATDIDETAIAFAREGFYTINDAADVSPERLRRFFNKEGDGYRVRREIREMILFANHNFIKDPPFSHLDLISCRNVLIYLNHTAQERVMETFHFALKPGGFLFLGLSESADGASDLYTPFSREYHIFQTRQVTMRAYPVPESVPSFNYSQTAATVSIVQEQRVRERMTLGDLHQRLLEQYAPPSVVVNEEYEIVHLSERAGRYLQITGGEPSQNLLKLIRPELRLELRSALYQAVQRQIAVEARGLKVNLEDHTETLHIHVRPVFRENDAARGFILIVFERTAEERSQNEIVVSSDEPVAKQLEEELMRVKAQLRASIEQHEFQAEELKASNEELQAMNEELRSAAEELETSKEELQSINEELRTVNQELKVKVEETTLASNNLQNLINSVDIGTIFLDRSFRVALFTPQARKLFNLIPNDIGRPLSDITNRLDNSDIITDAETVLEKLNVVEREVNSIDGRLFMMRVLPYRTEEDRINGVVVTFFDITERKKSEEALRKSEVRYRSLFNSIDEAYSFCEIILNSEGMPVDYRMLEVNPAFEKTTGLKPETAQGLTGKEAIPDIDAWWIETFGKVALDGVVMRFEKKMDALGKWFDMYAAPAGKKGKFTLVFTDITERKQTEEALRNSQSRLAQELERMHVLQSASSELIRDGFDAENIYSGIMTAATRLMHADAGSIQTYSAENNKLRLLASTGMATETVQYFEWVGPEGKSVCAIAAKRKERFFVDNIARLNYEKGSKDLQAYQQSGVIAVQSTPLISRSGNLVGVLSTYWQKEYEPSDHEFRFLDILARQAADLIERKNTEQSLKASEQRLKELVKQKDEFIGIASHELKTPVTSMKTYAEILLQQFESSGYKEGKNLMEKMDRQIDRLTNLIKDLLDTTKISEGRLDLYPQEFDMNALISDRIDEWKNISTSHKLLFSQGRLRRVNADMERISQVLTNLISNAIKYSPAGGDVVITTEQLPEYVKISVSDKGIGIAPEMKEKVFERFFRANHSKVQTYPGMGLGLYISASILKRHGGTISVENNPGGGSIFSFLLPNEHQADV